MNFDPTDAQKKLRLEIIDFCRKSGLNDGIDTRDRAGEFPRALFGKTGQVAGLQGLAVPTSYGGRGLDPLTTTVALEAFGYACEDHGLVSSVCAQLLSTAVPIAKFGTEEQKQALLPGLSDGSIIGATAMAETESGLTITAVREGDDFLLNGSLPLVTNAPVGDLALVFAVTAPEADAAARLTAFLVPLDTPGVTRGEALDTLGNRTAPVGVVTLENVRVPASSILGGRECTGLAVLNHARNWERVGFSAVRVGAMQRLTEATIKHVRALKKQFPASAEGPSQTVARMRIRLDTGRLLVTQAASRLEGARETTLNASVAALFVGDAHARTAQDALRLHGGSGSLTASGLARPFRDAFGGTSETQRKTIAEALGL